ncbi:uncharacterized protein M2139_002167 [Enterococcus sp. PF1-24]|uniref:HD domain-containing protein n=1 Tax=unclassified Enterococcus TaxID=2608891 RepID=UPI00247694DB|nr:MULTISPECIES: HD domain-containing protein [unclassified Enterococcus]MDH6365149.1 uncharacterized protein [Enterococcus sp. PFB1-1]MDH6402267.1 uncharacterized protein [Enterococcus sp. PF1-24]
MEEKIKKVIAFTEEKMQQDKTGHGMDHIQRVVKSAEKILVTEPRANQLIVLAAAYLHDTVDDKLVTNEKKAYQELQDFLVAADFQKEEIDEIIHIIKNMSYSKELDGLAEPLSLEGKIVQDADRIDALGAFGILRTSYYGGSKGHPIYDPAISPIDYQNKTDYRKGSTVINHFYEKLLLIADTMKTDYGKKEAKRRKQFMEEFLEEFFLEWRGE